VKKYFDYLNQLRQSGETNMFGAVPYLQKEFPELSFNAEQAQEILKAWMSGFQSPHVQEEEHSGDAEAEALFLFEDFIGDLAVHLAQKNSETICLCCTHHEAGHKCSNSFFCISGIQTYLLEQAALHRNSMESCCKNYFEYLDYLNSTGSYDQYTAEATLKVEFPYLASHEGQAKYVMASWMLKHGS